MTTLHFEVLGVAAPQGSLRPIVSKTTGRTFVKQSCKRTIPWRQEVAGVARAAVDRSEHEWPTRAPVALMVAFFLPRPAGHTGKRGLRPSAPLYPAKKPDLSKLVRALEDALTGIVYGDDAQIVVEHVEKVFVSNGEPPRAVVEVEELSEAVSAEARAS